MVWEVSQYVQAEVKCLEVQNCTGADFYATAAVS
jgi:hypothetical protein